MVKRTSDSKKISADLLARFGNFISRNLGLYFPENRQEDLYEKCTLAAREFGFGNPEDCIRRLLSAPLDQEQIEILSSYLTIGETHFYRDKSIYESLEKYVLPELLARRREQGKYMRIWSAGCSSGEEPYSVAILLASLITDIENWNISILATDISQKALDKAKKGIYGKWSFRSTPEWVKDEYFIKSRKDSYTIRPFIKDMVSFSYHNLAKDPFPSLVNNTSAIDIVFCRNVIMYFHPGLARKIINLFYRSLIGGGWLVVSGSEGHMVHKSRFVTVALPDTIFFRKDLLKSSATETLGTTEKQETTETEVLHDPGSVFSEADISQANGVKCSGNYDTQEIQAVPETTTDPVKKAAVLYEQGSYREAESIMAEYLSGDPDNSGAIILLAKIFSNQGKFIEATELIRKGIEIDKCNQEYYYLLALINIEQGRTEEAKSALQRSIYIDDHSVLSHYALGNIFMQQGKTKHAEKHFSNAISILDKYDRDNIIGGSDGLTAGRLTEIIKIKNLASRERIV